MCLHFAYATIIDQGLIKKLLEEENTQVNSDMMISAVDDKPD